MLCKHSYLLLSEDVVTANSLPSRIVSLDHLKALVNFQADHQLLLAPKLTLALLTPGHFNKMKVGHALHVFSKSCSAGLRYLVQEEGYASNFLTTAWFVDQVNHWFDLASSRHPVLALSKQQPEKYYEATSYLSSFQKMITSCAIGGKMDWKPVQTGIALSTSSLLGLAEDLLKPTSFLMTSRFSQDCLENLFSSVRARNPVPTPLELKNALKMISVGQFLATPKSGSYEADDNDYLADFLTVSQSKENVSPVQADDDVCVVYDIGLLPAELTSSQVICKAEKASLYYLAGYCIYSLQKKRELCSVCISSCKLKEGDMTESTLLQLREYRPDALFSVCRPVYELCYAVELVIRKVKDKVSSMSFPRKTLSSRCMKLPAVLNTSLPECHDLKRKLVAKFITVRLRIICKDLSKSLQLERSSTVSLGSKSVAMRDLASKVQ